MHIQNVFMLSERLLINSSLIIVKFWGSHTLYPVLFCFLLFRGIGVPNPCVIQVIFNHLTKYKVDKQIQFCSLSQHQTIKNEILEMGSFYKILNTSIISDYIYQKHVRFLYWKVEHINRI